MKHTDLNQIAETGVSHNPSIRKRVMLRNDDLTNLTNFAQARFAPGDVAAAHSHADMSEVFFVEVGTGNICVDGEDIALAPGVCVAIGPSEVHEVSNTGSEVLVLTYFGIRA
ncbi:MAG: cupin domain-containing protein [Geitlerinemataceae cyanobacterium]